MKTIDSGGRLVSICTADDILTHCPLCRAFAIVELSTELKAQQPDDTTHVCHPGFGGCNHGFALDA